MLDVHWQVDSDSLDDERLGGARVLRRQSLLDGKRHVALVELDGSIVLLGLSPGSVGNLDVRIAAASSDGRQRTLESIRSLFPEFEPDTREVPLTFWYFERGSGARNRTRRIEVPDWNTISGNYPAGTRRSMDELLKGFDPERAGQLLLWHGPPGSGKTYALRSLSWEWRDWAETNYVMDPETLFGEEPGYLMEILLHGDVHQLRDEDKWRLLILEDTGEMLGPDAKARVGQALSRLLNLADGVIGQGLRVLVLVTTNEPLEGSTPPWHAQAAHRH